MNPRHLHLIYIPAEPEEGTPDTLLEVIETDDIQDVLLETVSHPGSVAMELDCQDLDELPLELTQLGF